MKAIHVLGRINAGKDPAFINVAGQGQLHQNAMDGAVGIAGVNQLQERILADIYREVVLFGMDAQGMGSVVFRPHIGLRGRVITHQNGGQARHNALGLELLHGNSQFLLDGGGDFLAENEFCCHGSSRYKKVDADCLS